MDSRTLKCLLTPIAAVVAAWPVMAQTSADAAAGKQTIEVTASKRSPTHPGRGDF